MTDPNAALSGAEKMASKAKDGTLKIPGQGTFTFKFNQQTWHYHVYDSDGNEVKEYNTKQLSVARKWLREYFES